MSERLKELDVEEHIVYDNENRELLGKTIEEKNQFRFRFERGKLGLSIFEAQIFLAVTLSILLFSLQFGKEFWGENLHLYALGFFTILFVSAGVAFFYVRHRYKQFVEALWKEAHLAERVEKALRSASKISSDLLKEKLKKE